MTDRQLRAAMDMYGDTIFRLAVCRLQNSADAEDVYQEVFLKLFQKHWPEDDDDGHLKAWLIRTTIHRCTDMMRVRFRRSTVPLESIGEIPDASQNVQREIWDAVSRLPVKFRTVVHLHYAEGYSTDEIAGIMAIPAATVRTRLRRARLKLQEILGGNENA